MVVHEIRRSSLIDPQLPASLLPPDWPGDRAHALAADVYRAVNVAAWRWLQQTAGLPRPADRQPGHPSFSEAKNDRPAASPRSVGRAISSEEQARRGCQP